MTFFNRSFFPLLFFVTSSNFLCTNAAITGWKDVSTQVRRWLNFGSTFGSVTNVAGTPYDRVTGHPVFCVTTPWGSPYMNMEKLTDLDETVPTTSDSTKKTPSSLSEEQNEYRMVALYFMDPADALAVHGEMKQMENMQKSDIRLTAFSLAKALRQASNLGHGLPTGMAPDPLSGKLQVDDGATLRYKIVPAKRQLYYAARCIGKERVGLFAESAAEDAAAAVIGNSALEAANLARRREQRERKTPKQQQRISKIARQASHMEGYSGVPVFYCAAMRKQLPLFKQVMSGARHETPLFFNFEDLQTAWSTLQQQQRKRKNQLLIPERPVVEVFNLWDVLSSLDKDKSVRGDVWKKDPLKALKRRLFLSKQEPPTLQDITFVPNSDSVHYKDAISRRGNGKARLRPMR